MTRLARIAHRTQSGLRDARDWVARMSPSGRERAARALELRAANVPLLDALSRDPAAGAATAPRYRSVLIDGLWDNANYWTRYALLRGALGLAGARETGLIGRHSRERSAATFRAFGIDEIIDFVALRGPPRAYRQTAAAMLGGVRRPEDLLRLELPRGFPAEFFYDAVLKRQRRGAVDAGDPLIADYLAEALGYLEAARQAIERAAPELVVLSHPVNIDYAAVAWAAVCSNIPVILLFGDYGTARPIKLAGAADFFSYINRPARAEMEALDPPRRDRLAEIGWRYLEARFAGSTTDIGGIYAFQRRREGVDRAMILEHFGWSAEKPIVCAFASNWFDYPHGCGMRHFRDYQDWAAATIRAARETPDVNWLFKAHPCDEWYGAIHGPKLTDLLAEAPVPHIGLVPTAWNGRALLDSIDAGVTCHGTVGIELAALGKPVLVAESGWYGETGFVRHPSGRAEYEAALRGDWWGGFDAAAAKRLAREFAGWYFGVPGWQGGFVLDDDSKQDRNYEALPDLLAAHRDIVRREVETLRDWDAAPDRFYHTFKMARADDYAIGNVARTP